MRRDDRPVRATLLAAGWAGLYAAYRGYYAAGGTVGMFGIPLSWSQWYRINAIGAGILLLVAIAPPALLGAWQWPRARSAILALCWLMTVAFVVHALTDISLRAMSLTGRLHMTFPFWASRDQHRSDLQELLFNEPWFLIEGLLWGAIAWTGGLRRSPRRAWWVASAAAAILTLTVVGVLSGTGAIGRVIVG